MNIDFLKSVPVLDTEDNCEEAILLDGSTIQIPSPHTGTAYLSENRWCLDYNNHHFVFAGNIWQEQRIKISVVKHKRPHTV